MRGLDPRILFVAAKKDGRVEPGHDELNDAETYFPLSA